MGFGVWKQLTMQTKFKIKKWYFEYEPEVVLCIALIIVGFIIGSSFYVKACYPDSILIKFANEMRYAISQTGGLSLFGDRCGHSCGGM